jgi:hypothetical protein
VLAGLAVAVAGLGVSSVLRGRPDPSTLPKEIHVDIGTGYAIPRAFVTTVPLGSDGKPEHALIQVLWPTMEPLTEANRHLWAPELPGRQRINILVKRLGADRATLLHGAIRWGRVSPTPEPGPHGLLGYQRDHPRIQITARKCVPQDSTYHAPTGSLFVVDCSGLFNWRSQKKMKLYPICQVNYTLEDGSFLHYHFYVASLQYWRQIDTAVRDLVQSFRKP